MADTTPDPRVPSYLHSEAVKMLDILHGHGPGGRMNYAYADGYYALSIEKKFGLSVDQLKRAVNYRRGRNNG